MKINNLEIGSNNKYCFCIGIPDPKFKDKLEKEAAHQLIFMVKKKR